MTPLSIEVLDTVDASRTRGRGRPRGAATKLALENMRISVERLRAESARANDITTWPGHGVAAEDFTNFMRKGRLKASRVAAAASAVLLRQEEVLQAATRAEAKALPDHSDEELNELVEWAEAEAARLTLRSEVTAVLGPAAAEAFSAQFPGVAPPRASPSAT